MSAEPRTLLIVGLGNPGKRHAGTRHNIGYHVVDKLAAEYQKEFKEHAYIPALVAEWKTKEINWKLLKPLTFMNLSGRAVVTALNFWKLDLSSLFVIIDDVELVPGKLRLREKGNAGGHNGLSSIIESLGTNQFARLKVGIGRPSSDSVDLSDWILQPFEKSELLWLEQSITKAVCASKCWAHDGLETAMNRYNTKVASLKEDPKLPTSD